MKISALTILIGIFMYRNPFDYQIILGALIMVAINVYFILKLIRILLSFYTEKIENVLDDIKMKIKAKVPKNIAKRIHVSSNYIRRVIKTKILKAIEGKIKIVKVKDI